MNKTSFRVRYAETDQMGVVYHANYLVWMEIGRVELVRSCGFQYKDLEAEGLYLSVVEAHCRYVYPAKYDQEIVVETELTRASSRIVEFAYRIKSLLPERLLAEGATKHLWLNREWKPAKLPDKYRAALSDGRLTTTMEV